jgi:hypothetical protein
MTAYRQRALACAAALAQSPRRSRDLKADIPDAPRILHGNVYGWFVPVERGVYTLSESGRAALLHWPVGAADRSLLMTVPTSILSSSVSAPRRAATAPSGVELRDLSRLPTIVSRQSEPVDA